MSDMFCKNCQFYRYRPEGGGDACDRFGEKGYVLRDARSSAGPCKPEGIFFVAKNPSTESELSASQAREKELREKLEAAEVKAKKILELEQRVKVLTEAVSMAERYLAERVSNSGTVGRAIVLPALRQALIPPLPKESKE